MKMPFQPLPVAAIALCLSMPATFAQPSGRASHGDMKQMMEEGNRKMLSMQMTGDPDIDFAIMMRIHHEGALPMAQWELDHGKDPRMKAMARNIIAAQKKEIAEFDRWLASHGHEAGASTGPGAKHPHK